MTSQLTRSSSLTPEDHSRFDELLRDDEADLAYLADAWQWLACLTPRGTQKRWAQFRRPLIATRELESFGLSGVPRPTPADVSVLDVLAQLSHTAAWIVRELMHVVPLVPQRPEIWLPGRPASVDARPWLRLALHWLPAADALTRTDDDPIVEWVEARLTQLVGDVARLMGDVRDGQELAGICPWCGGRTSPVKTGQPTMRVHYPHEQLAEPLRLDELQPDEVAQPLIVCHGLNCSPPWTACGTKWRGKPAWNIREWDMLARRLMLAGA